MDELLDKWTHITSFYGVDTVEPPSLQKILRQFYAKEGSLSQDPIYEAYDKLMHENLRLIDLIKEKDAQLKRTQQNITTLKQTVDQQETQLKQRRFAPMDVKKEDKRVETPSKDKKSLQSSPTTNTSTETTWNNNPSKSKSIPHIPSSKSKSNEDDTSWNMTAMDANSPMITPSKYFEYMKANEKIKIESLMESFQKSKKDHLESSLPATRVRDFTFLFDRDEWNLDESTRRIASQIQSVRNQDGSNDALSTIFAHSLPYLMKGVLLAKRQELIPTLVMAICWTSDPSARYEMTHTLFNLIRVPDEAQRSIIVDGCVFLASIAGEDRTGTEILPHIVELTTSAYAERRILAADICGWLSPYVKSEMRLSLLFSILQQLYQDKASEVRCAVAINLSRILQLETSSIGPLDAKKFQQISDIMLRLLNDPETNVMNGTQVVLLPVFGDFSERAGRLQQTFLPALCQNIENIIDRTKGKVDTQDINELDQYAQALVYLAPLVYESALIQSPGYMAWKAQNPPNTRTVIGKKYLKVTSAFSKEVKDQLKSAFDAWIPTRTGKTTSNPNDWTILDWMSQDFIIRMLQITIKAKSSHSAVVDALCSILSAYGQEFGPIFTEKVLEPPFKADIGKLLKVVKSKGSESASAKRCGRMVVVYVVGILSCMERNVLTKYLEDFVLDISLERHGWSSSNYYVLESCIYFLMKHFPQRKDDWFEISLKLARHKESSVRLSVCKVFYYLLEHVNPTELSTKLLSTLETLNRDTDINVRCEVIDIFGELLTTVHEPATLDPIMEQIEWAMETSMKPKVMVKIAKIFRSIVLSVSDNVRDTFIVKKLNDLVNFAVNDDDLNRQKEVADDLYETFKVLENVSMDHEVKRQYCLPGLKTLHRYFDIIAPEKRGPLQKMVQDMEQSIQKSKNDTQKKEGITSIFNW